MTVATGRRTDIKCSLCGQRVLLNFTRTEASERGKGARVAKFGKKYTQDATDEQAGRQSSMFVLEVRFKECEWNGVATLG